MYGRSRQGTSSIPELNGYMYQIYTLCTNTTHLLDILRRKVLPGLSIMKAAEMKFNIFFSTSISSSIFENEKILSYF